jgi:radical SAM superfamily enzyme YgiQ (UPF0313 family)
MREQGLRIILVSPKGEFLCRSPEFGDFMRNSRDMRTILHFWNGIGVALPTLAALTPPGFEVSIIDENMEPIDFDCPCDIVGITAMTQQATRAYEIADEFRRKGRHVVLGGIHVTALPDEAAQHADTVIVGEAENLWPLFLQDFQAGKKRPVYDQTGVPPVDMTRIPLPRYELLAKYRYPVVYVQATRGCPHDCEFCVASNIYGKRYKHKTVQQVVNEVTEAKRLWKYAQIGFADDNMFVDHAYSRDLVRRLKDLKIAWFAICDIAVAQDEAFLRELHESGCRTLLIGFESVSKTSLHGMNKDGWKEKRFDRYPEYIQRIQHQGIGVYGSFILGLDDDGPESVDATVNFVNDNILLGTQITLLTPFPGSRLRARLEREQRIVHNDWKWYTVWNSVIRHPSFTPEELERGLLRAYEGVYNPESNTRRAQYFRKVCEDIVERC